VTLPKTLDLRTKISDGQRMATMLRQGIKQYFGIRSEKLAELGLRKLDGPSGTWTSRRELR
jgi:hypothetical protein